MCVCVCAYIVYLCVSIWEEWGCLCSFLCQCICGVLVCMCVHMHTCVRCLCDLFFTVCADAVVPVGAGRADCWLQGALLGTGGPRHAETALGRRSQPLPQHHAAAFSGCQHCQGTGLGGQDAVVASLPPPPTATPHQHLVFDLSMVFWILVQWGNWI